MKAKIRFSIYTLSFFFLYMQVMGWIWNRLFDIGPALDVLAMLVILVLTIPLSALSAQKVLEITTSR